MPMGCVLNLKGGSHSSLLKISLFPFFSDASWLHQHWKACILRSKTIVTIVVDGSYSQEIVDRLQPQFLKNCQVKELYVKVNNVVFT